VATILPSPRRVGAAAAVTSEYAADCGSRRETIDFGSSSIDELNLRFHLENDDRRSDIDISVSAA